MFARSHSDLHGLRRSVERTRRLSDRVVGVGPFSLGLDGVLAWIPGVGLAYSVAAGGFLLVQAVRARAGATTLAKMAAYLVADSLTDMIPIPFAPAAADMLFTGHKWAADALLKSLDETTYYEGGAADAAADPGFSVPDRRRRRVVYLR